VETPEHILLLCGASPALVNLRREFQATLQREGLFFPVFTPDNALPSLKNLVYNRASVTILAKFVYNSLAIVEQTPLYRP
jgi:hypothetical protein